MLLFCFFEAVHKCPFFTFILMQRLFAFDQGKKVAKGKAKSEAEHPSKEELRKKICEILKEVDFNTVSHYFTICLTYESFP